MTETTHIQKAFQAMMEKAGLSDAPPVQKQEMERAFNSGIVWFFGEVMKEDLTEEQYEKFLEEVHMELMKFRESLLVFGNVQSSTPMQ